MIDPIGAGTARAPSADQGEHRVMFSSRDDDDRRVAAGAYLVRAATPEVGSTARVLLTR